MLRLLRAYAHPRRRRTGAEISLVSLGRDRLLKDVAGPARVDLDSRAHRAREGNRPQVPPLGRGRLGPDQLVDHRRVVLKEATVIEALLADHQVDDGVAIGPVFDLTRL